MSEVKHICNKYVAKVIPLAFDESMSYYECICNLKKYCESLFNVLNEYAEDFFENLDVQDEINNKLQEMYENGDLEELVTQFLELSVLFIYPTVNDMLSSDSLTAGKICYTQGFYSLNDGGGATYLIRAKEESDTIDNMYLFEMSDNTLVAELLKTDTIMLKQLGAKTSEDSKDIIQSAINNFKKVIVDDDYIVSSTLSINNIDLLTMEGEGSITISHEEEANLFNVTNSSNLTFKDFTIANDVKHISNVSPLNVYMMLVENCNNLEFNNFKMINAYNKGIDIKACGYVNFINCNFKDCYYDMLTILTECHDITVDNCIFDTTGCTYTNSYLLCTGSGDYSLVDYMTKNITIKNSKFLNNPTWEGIDSHGCYNLIVENNYIENCLDGISIFYDERQNVRDILNGNISVINNTIICNNVNGRYGITVNGGLETYSNNVIIENNKITGYSKYADIGAISVTYLKNYKIINNLINNVNYYGIRLFYSYMGDINNNNITLTNVAQEPIGIRAVLGVWLANIKNNIINNSYIGIWNSGRGLSILDNNLCIGATAKYYTTTPNGTIIGDASASNDRVGCKGVYTVDDNDIKQSYCTDSVVRSVSATLSGIKLTGTSGNNLITCDDPIYNYLCIGQEIILTGAGTGGSNLTTIVTDIIGNSTFIIKDNLSSSISNLSPQTTASTFVAL